MKLVTKTARNGLKFTTMTPESVQEHDTLARRDGAALEGAINDTWYRGVFPDFWEAIAYILSRKYNVERRLKPHPQGKTYAEGDRKGQPIMVSDESDPELVDRIAALQSDDPKKWLREVVQPICDEVGANGWDYENADGTIEHVTIAYDPSERERKERVAKPGKFDTENATKFITEGQDLARICRNATKLTGKTYTLDGLEGDALVNALALVVRDYRIAVSKQAPAGLTS